MDVSDEVREDLESRANVVGTGRGPKRVRGRATDEECLIVFVSRKVPEEELDEADRIPPEVDIDGERVKTDVQEVGDVRAQAAVTPVEKPDRKRRWRPAPAGVSFGHPEVTAGTLGSPPLRTEDDRTVVVTNAHVAAPVGQAQRGDSVLQPGPADGGAADDAIGRLREWSEIRRDEPNTTDSALVEVDPAKVKRTILGVGELVGFTEPTTGETHTKSGRTTGVTTGDLRARDARIRVRGYYDEPTVFEGMDVFGPMSAGGDSGSLIGVERDDGFHATDLLFAGSDRSTIGVPIPAVEAEHGALTPVAAGDGDDPGSFRATVRRRLVDAYGADAVRDGSADGPEFRVAGPVPLVVELGKTEGEALNAVGRAMAHADAGTVPVVAYPAGERTDRLDRVARRVALVPVEG